MFRIESFIHRATTGTYCCKGRCAVVYPKGPVDTQPDVQPDEVHHDGPGGAHDGGDDNETGMVGRRNRQVTWRR